jgi:hypothetical protein
LVSPDPGPLKIGGSLDWGTRTKGGASLGAGDTASRPKHQDKDLERILRLAEAQDWRVEKRPKGYFKMKCNCAELHMKTVHLTPSNPNYGRNLLGWLRRCSCWKEQS